MRFCARWWEVSAKSWECFVRLLESSARSVKALHEVLCKVWKKLWEFFERSPESSATSVKALHETLQGDGKFPQSYGNFLKGLQKVLQGQ